MSEREETTNTFDSIRLYIWMMSGLTLIASGWLLYNWQLLGDYQEILKKGSKDFEAMQSIEEELVLQSGNIPQGGTIDNELGFFNGLVPGVRPSNIRRLDPVKRTINDFSCIERRYTIEFENIPRQRLAEYIFRAQEQKKFLKLDKVVFSHMRNVKEYEDKWQVSLQFAYRTIVEE